MNLRLALALICLNPALHAAPPKELVSLQQSYAFAVAERVTGPHETALAALNAKFTAALDNAATQAKSAGDLPAVLAIQGDKKLLAEKQPLPADDEKTPESLKKLRAIYRDQLAKLDEQRTANTAALLAPYTAKLQELEATLTKTDRIAEAKEVMDYRESLKADAPPAPAMTAAAAAPATPEPEVSAKPARPFPPADDRKAAEWALGYAYRINVKAAGQEKDISLKPGDALPEGSFELVGIDINLQGSKKPFQNLETIAGLQHLRWLMIYNGPLTDADTDIFASLPKIESLGFQKNGGKLTGARFELLGACPELKHLDLRACPVTLAGLRSISKLQNLQQLTLTGTDIGDKELPVLAGLTSLTSLKLDLTQVTSRGLAGLTSLNQLTGLGWSPSPRKAKAELEPIAAAFPQVTTFQMRSKGDLTAEDAAALAAFPKLEKVYLEYETCSKPVLAGLSQIPSLKFIRCYYAESARDDALEALAQNTTIETMEFDNMPLLTGTTLTHLAKMKALKKVVLSRCDKIDRAAIDAFKAARPEVNINK